jgi:hypothetical protein
VPIVAVDFVFIAPDLRSDACAWLQKELPTIIANKKEGSLYCAPKTGPAKAIS